MNEVLHWLQTPAVIDGLIAVGKAIAILLGMVITAAWLIWVERRLLGLWQDRLGPNRVGPLGLGQVVADMIKIFFKEDWTPSFVDRPVFVIAPVIALVTMMLGFIIVPIAPGWQVADLTIGALFWLAIASIGVYAALLAGWASNSKYSLLGSMRSAAQMITYEVFMGTALMGVVIQAGSFRLSDIVAAQEHLWYVVPQFFGFLLFALAGVAATHRSPFDLPEAEQELAAGFHTEYSSMKFGMFFVGEYVGVVLVSALLTTFYLGGWHGPLLPPIVWFLLKTAGFITFFILLRAALPRPRYDQLMDAGWKFCLPLALINLLVTAALVLVSAKA